MAQQIPSIWQLQCAARLRRVREFRGLTQREMGDAIATRFERASYTRFETGTRRMTAETVARLCLALDVTAEFLLLGRIESYLEEMTSVEFCDQLARDAADLGTSDWRARSPDRPEGGTPNRDGRGRKPPRTG
jgi:transcriptional regulator with XRE-family HTH domain